MIETILSEARAAVAGGASPDWKALRDRIRAAAASPREEREALQRLERVGAVHRARGERPQPTASATPVRNPPLLRTKPTVSGNMDVRRGREHVLAWSPLPAVETWEVRISERPDRRSDYALREERTLPATTSELELALGEAPVRVHLLGRGRGGKLVQRAIVSGLTREGWSSRWERRATAS